MGSVAFHGGLKPPPHHPRESATSLTNDGGAEMPKGHYLTEAVKDAIWELRAKGLSDREIGRRLGLARGTVSHHLARAGGTPTEGTAAPREVPEPGRARGDLARDRPRALGPRDRPHPRALPHDDRPGDRPLRRAGALPRPRRRARGLKEGAAAAADQARAAPGASPARDRAPQGGQLPPADRGLAQARIPRQ